MFGYVRPLAAEMKVRENEMFRAVYCGLCRAMGHHTGCASRLTLSYDFVFLAVLRSVLTKTDLMPEYHRCAVHPLKKRAMAADNDVFAYCAAAAACLTREKLSDDIRDERGLRRAASSMLRPAASAMCRRAGGITVPEAEIRDSLSELHSLEAENCPSVDRTAACFGRLLSRVFAEGLPDPQSRIAGEIGWAVGQFIYVIDAADDVADDIRAGKYNPFSAMYGTDILERRSVRTRDGRTVLRECLKREIAESVETAALCSLSRLEAASELIDFSGCQADAVGILKNTVFLGMPAELRRVLALTDGADTSDILNIPDTK